jgi:hypothetical protein
MAPVYDDVPDEVAGQVRRTRTKRRDTDIRGEFTVVAVPGTHRDRTKSRYRGTHLRRQTKAERQKILLEARRDGLSWREAGKRAGYRSVGAAYVAGQEAIADIPREAADEARTIEMQRIDELVRTFMPLARRGDPEAGNLILRAIDRRARMLGLDLAEPQDHARIDVRLQALIVELIAMPPEEFERNEAELARAIDASQRGANRALGSCRAATAGVEPS